MPRSRRLFVAGVTAALIFMGSLAVGSPVLADPVDPTGSSCFSSGGHIDACNLYSGLAYGNFNVFPEVCQGCAAATNPRMVGFVVLWQNILWADYGPQIGGTCNSFVDGQFGPNTRNWTIYWQTHALVDHHDYPSSIGVDGRVGSQTWGAAAKHYVDSRYHGLGGRAFLLTENRVNAPSGAYDSWSFHTCLFNA